MLKDIFCPICKTPANFSDNMIYGHYNSCECHLLIGTYNLYNKSIDINYFFYNKEIKLNVIVIFYNKNKSEIYYKENLYNDKNYTKYIIEFNPVNKSFDELIRITSNNYKLQLIN